MAGSLIPSFDPIKNSDFFMSDIFSGRYGTQKMLNLKNGTKNLLLQEHK